VIFNQFSFLFVFMPLVAAAFFMPGLERWRPLVLLAASFVFYGLSGLEHAVVLFAATVWVYAVTRSPAIVGDRLRLTAAITLPLLALVYYKYTGFIVRQFSAENGWMSQKSFSLFSDILLPAGISFFTFQLVAYAVDRYRGQILEAPRFRLFALYISFFPQLVAGPILRYFQVQEPLHALTTFRITPDRLTRAIGYVCLGLALKVLFADALNDLQAPMIARPGGISTISGLFVVFAYSFQIYFDFYGYSLIAIGLGTLFGFAFPDNFVRPYETPNPREFWRRWHVTLSYWIRDYLYLPLGGNKAYARNILIVFAAVGLWHGAGWTFVVWGLYHAALVLAYHFTAPAWNALPRLAQIAVTFVLVSFGWTLFVFDFDSLVLFFGSLAGLGDVTVAAPTAGAWVFLILSAIMCFGVRVENMVDTIQTESGIGRMAALAGLFVFTTLFLEGSHTFIYFRF
jgi:alginate O-acetyltransferase complex protein AlgI